MPFDKRWRDDRDVVRLTGPSSELRRIGVDHPRGERVRGLPVTRRQTLSLGAALMAGGAAFGPRTPALAAVRSQATPLATPPADPGAAIMEIVRDAVEQQSLNAVIVRVLIDGQEVVTEAVGESMTGVPATTEMHFRNGAVAIAYMSTLLLRLVDQQMIGLDDTLATWLPDIPDADKVTFRMLANMTSGYPDYVQSADFGREFYADPFRQFTPDDQLAFAFSSPRTFAPGTNWDYAHTNYVLMGLALENLTGKPLDVLLKEEVLDPLGLHNTVSWSTPEITPPVLHAFTSERRSFLGIPEGVRFYEESTYWNPS
jgi:CubicO group peptidase (beta-lactamase class C family)